LNDEREEPRSGDATEQGSHGDPTGREGDGEAASAGPSDGRRAIRELPVKEVRELIAGAPPEPGDLLWRELQSDPRKGVRAIVAALKRKSERRSDVLMRERAMRRHEAEMWERGLTLIAGIDEAGRGPLAGPVVAAAVVLPEELPFTGIDDSKKLTPEKREKLFGLIREHAVAFGVGMVPHTVIDEINILRATHRAAREALSALGSALGRSPDHALVDGDPIPDLAVPQTPIHKGDELSTAIAAASIVAKVTRDRLLVEYDSLYPGYGFAEHKGYGTPAHLAALTRLGPCEIHRRSFAPVSSTGSFTEEYETFKRLLLAAGDLSALERAASKIAASSKALDPYELSRLRRLYKRAYARLKAGLPTRR
jgi:ribonuclease HII